MSETTYPPGNYPTNPLPPGPPPDAAPTPPAAPRRRPLAGVVALVLASALVGGGTGALVTHQIDANSPTPATSAPPAASASSLPISTTPSGQTSYASVAAAVMPSVVSIAVQGSNVSDLGSGIILDTQGHIITNNHVIAAAANGGQIVVRLSDGRTEPAQIVGRDPISDLAVLKIPAVSGLRPASLGSSSALAVGDRVVAIGSPLGLSGTVTAGIVSALNRPVQTGSVGGGSDTTSTVFDAIQTDAPINPGNSGGPLVNMRGQVIGINSAIATLGASTGGQSGSIGLGFAIPINQAQPIINSLIQTGKAKHAWLGVQVTDQPGLVGGGARLVAVVPGSPAAKAGLRAGDVITGLDQQLITNANALVAATRAHQPGQQVTIRYQRGGQTATTTLTLGIAPF